MSRIFCRFVKLVLSYYKTQYLYKNKKAVVPLIIGPTWPRKTDIDVDKKELYSKIILLVFKPWRQLEYLKKAKDDANREFEEKLAVMFWTGWSRVTATN